MEKWTPKLSYTAEHHVRIWNQGIKIIYKCLLCIVSYSSTMFMSPWSSHTETAVCTILDRDAKGLKQPWLNNELGDIKKENGQGRKEGAFKEYLNKKRQTVRSNRARDCRTAWLLLQANLPVWFIINSSESAENKAKSKLRTSRLNVLYLLSQFKHKHMQHSFLGKIRSQKSSQ